MLHSLSPHSSIKIRGSKVIYIDPFGLSKSFNDADYVFCTHSHYDHFSLEDIERVRKNGTKLVMPKSMASEIKGLEIDVLFVEPDKEYIFLALIYVVLVLIISLGVKLLEKFLAKSDRRVKA